MADVIDFKAKQEAKQELSLEDQYYANHEYILDECDELFDVSVILTVSDGILEMSATTDDLDYIKEMLKGAEIKLEEVTNELE